MKAIVHSSVFHQTFPLISAIQRYHAQPSHRALLVTVFSMAWYKIVMQRFQVTYRQISHSSLVFSWHKDSPKGLCICCSSICTLVQFVFELVQNILNWYKIVWTGTILIVLVQKQRKYFNVCWTQRTHFIDNSCLPFIYLVQEVTDIRFAEHSEQDRNSKTCWKYLTVWFDQE